jgi:hypothetical protein
MYFERECLRKFVHGIFLRYILLDPHRIVGRGGDEWHGWETTVPTSAKGASYFTDNITDCVMLSMIFICQKKNNYFII